MMQLCRMLDRVGTETMIEDNGIADTAPDNFVHEKVRMEDGDTAFVQVEQPGGWETWAVTRVSVFMGMRAYVTRKTSEKAARRLMRMRQATQ